MTWSNTPESDTTINNTSGVNNQVEKSVFESLRESRKLHPRNVTTAYININSIRNKYDEIKELLSDKIVDLLFIAETKLDQSFNDNLFKTDGYKLFRRDRNCHDGGIMALVNIDFPSSRKGNLESENISFEVKINDKKWLIMGIYKAPSMSDNDFSTYFY